MFTQGWDGCQLADEVEMGRHDGVDRTLVGDGQVADLCHVLHRCIVCILNRFFPLALCCKNQCLLPNEQFCVLFQIQISSKSTKLTYTIYTFLLTHNCIFVRF